MQGLLLLVQLDRPSLAAGRRAGSFPSLYVQYGSVDKPETMDALSNLLAKEAALNPWMNLPQSPEI
jgi:hypothetical protein